MEIINTIEHLKQTYHYWHSIHATLWWSSTNLKYLDEKEDIPAIGSILFSIDKFF